MAKHNNSTAGYTDSMLEHKKILESIKNKNEGFDWYRLCGGRNKYLCLEYLGKQILVLEGKESKGFGQLGIRCNDKRIVGNPIEVRERQEQDPEPDSLFTRYRYRPGWSFPYTIRFNSYESILPEIERVLKIITQKTY